MNNTNNASTVSAVTPATLLAACIAANGPRPSKRANPDAFKAWKKAYKALRRAAIKAGTYVAPPANGGGKKATAPVMVNGKAFTRKDADRLYEFSGVAGWVDGHPLTVAMLGHGYRLTDGGELLAPLVEEKPRKARMTREEWAAKLAADKRAKLEAQLAKLNAGFAAPATAACVEPPPPPPAPEAPPAPAAQPEPPAESDVVVKGSKRSRKARKAG